MRRSGRRVQRPVHGIVPEPIRSVKGYISSAIGLLFTGYAFRELWRPSQAALAHLFHNLRLKESGGFSPSQSHPPCYDNNVASGRPRRSRL